MQPLLYALLCPHLCLKYAPSFPLTNSECKLNKLNEGSFERVRLPLAKAEYRHEAEISHFWQCSATGNNNSNSTIFWFGCLQKDSHKRSVTASWRLPSAYRLIHGTSNVLLYSKRIRNVKSYRSRIPMVEVKVKVVANVEIQTCV